MANNFFQFISPKVNYDFLGVRKTFIFVSGFALLASFVLLGTRGLNFGLDFRGGTEVQLEFVACASGAKVKNCVPKDKLKINHLRKELIAAFPGSKLVVQQTGNQGTGFLLKFDKISSINDADRNLVQQHLKTAFGKLLAGASFRKEGGNKIDVVFTRKLTDVKKTTKKIAQKKGTPKKVAPKNPKDMNLRIQQLLKKLKLQMKKKNQKIKIIQPRKTAPAPRRAVVPAKRAVVPAKRAVVPAKRVAPKAPVKKAAAVPAKRAVAPVKRTVPAPAIRVKPMFQEFFAPAARRPTPVTPRPTVRGPAVRRAATGRVVTSTSNKGNAKGSSSLRKIDIASISKIKIELTRIKKLFLALGLGTIKISKASRRAGNQYEYAITFAGLGAKLRSKLDALYGHGAFKILQVESVGPSVGDKLRADGITSIFLANLFILIYVSIRFDFRYAPGAVIALLHDVSITTGVFSLLFLPFDLAIIAALLTIIGYSLNDTIVVYDRIRENWQKSRVEFEGVMNRSINETLSRTLLTSVTTFIAVLPIFIIGGDNIKWFAFAMMFGILIGTYSSIAIASPLVYVLDQYFTRKERDEDKEIDEKRERRRRRRAGLSEQPDNA